ncbi:DNA polymerase III subunit delta [Bacillus aquiflavi]|uniref:DNA polymerase III subunit delta n=1 Tax=Bacillus aquiflavi TaxID=2672567 RepID=UPI001CA98745|nr:DNA polymerase III subunit delta [Bacillus aquiflavi]UAC47312.1 DNA polymerase III subunit delta [Bacillus aquiflavi]
MVFNIWKKIKKKQFASLYLVYGTEAFLINETKQLLVHHVLEKEEIEFNFSSYDLEETPIETALEDAETFPFIGDKRLIILQNPFFLTSAKGKVDHHLAKLEAYLKEPAPYSIVVFLAPYEKLDERRKLTKELKRKAETIEGKKLNERELKEWIHERASLHSILIDEDAVDLLLLLVGTNLFLLTSEIDKLALYAKHIDIHTVEKLVSRSLEENIFHLVDKIVHRKIDEALRIFYDLLKQNQEPIKILSIISGQFRLIYQVKELARQGYGEKQIAGYLKVHPYRVKLAAGQARFFSNEELIRKIDLLSQADYEMKTGAMNKVLIIEMFLFKLNDTPIKQS